MFALLCHVLLCYVISWNAISDQNNSPIRMNWRKRHAIAHHNINSIRVPWLDEQTSQHESTRMHWRKWHAINHLNTTSTRMSWEKWYAVNHHNINDATTLLLRCNLENLEIIRKYSTRARWSRRCFISRRDLSSNSEFGKTYFQNTFTSKRNFTQTGERKRKRDKDRQTETETETETTTETETEKETERNRDTAR